MTDHSLSKNSTPPRRAWFRFSLRSLLVLVTLVSGLLGWNMHRRRQHQQAISSVQRLGGSTQQVLADLSLPSRLGAIWTQDNSLWLHDLNLTDDDLAAVPLESMHTLRGFHAADNQLSDSLLERLAGRTELESLDLTNNPQITDAGLAHLKHCRGLKQLLLRRNPGITDAGLIHLDELKNLEVLVLIGSSVTPEGGKRLQSQLPNAKIVY